MTLEASCHFSFIILDRHAGPAESGLQGHFNVCKLILENVIVKNPSNDKGETPLSIATQRGRKDICKLFTKRKSLDVNTDQKAKLAKK